MQKKMLTYKEHLKNPNLIAVAIALLTTGFSRLQFLSGLPSSDGGYYTFATQYIFNAITQNEFINVNSPLFLYQFMNAWVYGLEVNQIILLRLIDGLIAVAASIILFKVILKESGSTLFTLILVAALLIIMNDTEIVMSGFRNSIWAAYLPLFSALLVWQNATKEDKYSFYLIGGFVSFGILLREPFLVFFLLAGIAIHIGYGWRALVKYLIGCVVLGFSVLGFVLMFRGWDLYSLINYYIFLTDAYKDYVGMGLTFASGIFKLIQSSWFVCVISLTSMFYFIKLYFGDKKSVDINRFYFWVLVALLPLMEPILKIGFQYHYSNCLVGLAGLSAMGWKYLSLQESKRIKKSSMILIGLMSLFVILPAISTLTIKNNHILTLSDVAQWVKAPNSLQGKNNIERSQYLTLASKIYSLSREDSTLVVSGLMSMLYPLTELLPPTYELSWLRYLHIHLNFDDDKLIKIIKKHRPTLIVTTDWNPGEALMSGIIDKIDLYEKVGYVPTDSKKHYGWKSGTIYRLKDF